MCTPAACCRNSLDVNLPTLLSHCEHASMHGAVVEQNSSLLARDSCGSTIEIENCAADQSYASSLPLRPQERDKVAPYNPSIAVAAAKYRATLEWTFARLFN